MDVDDQSRPAVLHDGTMQFVIRRAGQDDTLVSADLWVLKMAIEAVEDAQGIKPNERNELVATPELFIRLAEVFQRYGITGCTPSMAGQIWHAVHAAFADVKKNMSGTPN